MHPIAELGNSVPAFLGKLWKLVEDPETDDLICWAPNGRSFFIRNQAQFARELLPHYYKHNNMASFVRQLNMYGFHKKVSVELGGLKCDKDEMEFAHQYFCKGHPCLLEHIKRKIASTKGQDASQTPMKPELMNKMLTEVRSMRGRQEHLDSKLGAMKRENEALWRELAMLRQKHLKQQQIVNKLIHFLVTLVQPSRSGGLSVKRRYPLMIDDPSRPRAKQSKMSNNKPNVSPTGPVIHELDPTEHEMEPECIVDEILENRTMDPEVQSPGICNSFPLEEDSMETVELITSPIHLSDQIQIIPQSDIDSKKKRSSKGKKPRKNKVPVKILIPPLEPGKETREELVYAELPSVPVLSPRRSKTSAEQKGKTKHVPLATVRSSKLAAMAANINSSNDTDADPETDVNDSTEESSTTVNGVSPVEKLDNIDQMSFLNEFINVDLDTTEEDADHDKQSDAADEKRTTSGNNKGSKTDCTSANANDLSLSCVNDPLRLAPTDEVDNHLETVQSELDNLRDLLRGEGYSIDANTLLGLFGADDPMSFGIPMNPELDPYSHQHKDKDDEGSPEMVNGGGELMAYNPQQNFLDFDNDMLLGATTSRSSPDLGEVYDDSECFEIEESKASLLESLSAVNNSTSS